MREQFQSVAAVTLALALASGSNAAAAPPAAAAHGEHWVTSWYAAPQPAWDASFPLPMGVPAWIERQTVRDTVRLSLGGARIRLVFSNRYGQQALRLGPVRAGAVGDAQPGVPLTFSGQAAIAIAPGASATSDALALPLPDLARLAVNSYLPARSPVSGFHWGAQQTMRLAPGDLSDTPVFPADAAAIGGRLFLSAVLVEAPAKARSVAVLGDSITDGNGSTPDADRRWPDFLAARLAPHGIAVANAGISGGRLLRDGMGRSALARLEQDVFAQPGVSDLIVLLGTNDIGWPGGPFAPAEQPAALDELAAGYRQLAAAAHARGMRISAATVPPFEGALEGTPFAGHYSPAKDALRRRFNDWIRTSGMFDAVIDFDALLRDPARPSRLRPGFDSGDHLHPGDAGYRAMAAAVDIAPLLHAQAAPLTRRGIPPPTRTGPTPR